MKTFFAHLDGERLESVYWDYHWESIFKLKYYCKLSLQEQALMSAEERMWYFERFVKEKEREREEEEKMQRKAKMRH